MTADIPSESEDAPSEAPYVGWALPAAERERLLELLPPQYPDVYANHVTLHHGDDSSQLNAPPAAGRIVGYADDQAGVQVVVVAVDGTVERPDGGIFHITWSIDRSRGRRQRHSNDVLRSGWRWLPEPLAIELEPIRAKGC